MFDPVTSGLGIYVKKIAMKQSRKHIHKVVHRNHVHGKGNWKHPKCCPTAENKIQLVIKYMPIKMIIHNLYFLMCRAIIRDLLLTEKANTR